MPGWHDARCVSFQLGRMEGGINEEEDRDLSRAGKQCPTHYRMTSSHQSPGNREVTGMWAGEGGQLRMSRKRHKLWRKWSALIKQWWQSEKTPTQCRQNIGDLHEYQVLPQSIVQDLHTTLYILNLLISLALNILYRKVDFSVCFCNFIVLRSENAFYWVLDAQAQIYKLTRHRPSVYSQIRCTS